MWGLVAAGLLSGATVSRGQIATGAELNAAINSESGTITLATGTVTTVANTTSGTAGTVTYSSPFDGIIGFSTNILGSNASTLSGALGATPLFFALPANETASGAVDSGDVTSYNVTVSNLTITNGVSHGGSGAGGGAGLGGAMFVGAGANVTLNNVTFTGNSAIGGTGAGYNGGGGLGGGNSGSFGGGGLFATTTNLDGGGANGGTYTSVPGTPAGFGGGGAIAGAGGFGGGSGFGSNATSGFGAGGSDRSDGGFGGGGGNMNHGLVGGFGGGDPSIEGVGGGGAGLGGAIFVQNEGTVTLTGNDTLSGDTVAGGTGGNNGAAAGAEIFMMTGSAVYLAPGYGSTVTIGRLADNTGTVSDIADDSTYSITNGASTVGAGSGATLTVGNDSNAGGSVVLYGENTYAGGTVITSNSQLVVAQDSNLGATDPNDSTVGAVTIQEDSELLTDPTINGSSDTSFTSNRSITVGSYYGDLATLAAVNGTSATYNGTISGMGEVDINDISGSNSGTVTLAGSNTYMGGTEVTGGTLLIMNSGGSATGSGFLTVDPGATIGGYGTSSGLGFEIVGLSPSFYQANVLVGQTSAADTNTTQVLTLQGMGVGFIANAKLSFNLNTNVVGQGNQLNVGSTAITFGTGAQSTVLQLNLQGNGIIAANSAYVLIAGNDGGVDQYYGLDLGTSTGSLDTGLVTQILDSEAGGTGNLVLGLSGLAATYYGNGSYLFLYQNDITGADDIEVEVVPEPGTWAMMVGGLTMLVFWQRRKRKF